MFQRSFKVRPISLLRQFVLLRPVIGRVLGLAVFRDELGRLFPIGFPIEIRDLVFGAEEILRMPMAFEAPRHAVRLGMPHHRHVIDLAVAARATDPAVHVGGVIVINVIRRAMELHPLDRLPGFPAGPHRFQFRIILLDLGVAVHAGLGIGQIRMGGDVDEAVAIPAIHPELGHVNIMGERHWLDGLITDAGILRRDVIPGAGGQAANDERCRRSKS